VFVAEEEVHVLRTSERGLEMPVVECPSYARGACPFLCPWSALCFCLLHMYNKFVLLYGTVVQYEKRADTNERTTNEIPFNRKDCLAPFHFVSFAIGEVLAIAWRRPHRWKYRSIQVSCVLSALGNTLQIQRNLQVTNGCAVAKIPRTTTAQMLTLFH